MKQFHVIIITMILLAGTVHADTSLNASSRQKTSARIVGGEEAEPGAWSWMAALINSYDKSEPYNVFCGGSLIHSRWVVTAAHCVKISDWSNEDMDPGDIAIVMGIHNVENDRGKRVSVKKIISHPLYDNSGNSMDSDIALIELEYDVSYTIIPLVSGESTLEGKEATAKGWGITGTGGYAEKLQQVTVPIVSNQTCKESYMSDKITDNMICAGYSEGGKDACTGDSGGPLAVQDGNAWKLAGIVSWGEGCAEPDYYGVYTRITRFYGWVGNYVPLQHIPGDFNGNGKLDLEDGIGILKSLTSLSGSISGDFNSNGKLGMEDVIGILQTLAGHRP